MNAGIPPLLRIGSRGSPLALAQTQLCMAALMEHVPALAEPGRLEVVVLRASGDHNPLLDKDVPLVDKGGKGLFTKELEEALLQNRIDIAVHSMKDVPTWLPVGLKIAATLAQGDRRDALLSRHGNSLASLPPAARIGTTSLRRQAQLLHARPDLRVEPLRGNVDTRLKKLAAGQVDATLLAYAGLKRLGLDAKVPAMLEMAVLDVDVLLPAVNQGIIGMEIRSTDSNLAALLHTIGCPKTFAIMQAERAMLEALDGSCRTPLAGLAEYAVGDASGKTLRLRGLVAHPAGTGLWQDEATGAAADAVQLGHMLGQRLRQQVPPGILPA